MHMTALYNWSVSPPPPPENVAKVSHKVIQILLPSSCLVQGVKRLKLTALRGTRANSVTEEMDGGVMLVHRESQLSSFLPEPSCLDQELPGNPFPGAQMEMWA